MRGRATRPTTRRHTRDARAFSLMEMVVIVVIIGILATIATFGTAAVRSRSSDSSKTLWITDWLLAAQGLYAPRVEVEPSYTFMNALLETAADLPPYTGSDTAAPGSTMVQSYRIDADTGPAVFSTAPNHVVALESSGTLYVAVMIDSSRAVFGKVSTSTAPEAWVATCSFSTCDASSAATLRSGGYGPGTSVAAVTSTTSPLPTISYSSGVFSLSSSAQTLSPTVSGSPTSFSYTGTLPSGVSFSTSTGVFTGPSSWVSPVSQIALGLYEGTACTLRADSSLQCWGANTQGQLGDNTTTNRTTPVQVTGLTSGVSNVSSGGFHTCAVVSASARCWGYNVSGQIGDGTVTQRNTPTQVSGLTSNVLQVTTGDYHSCALLTTGAVKCWGQNNNGQLGDNTTTYRSTPVDVTGLSAGVVQISSGLRHVCALFDTGGVKCWGWNSDGQVGDGTVTQRNTPTQVSGLTSGAVSITSGLYHTCALFDTGGVKCWGQNLKGQVGDGTTTARSIPTQVSSLTSGVAKISSGGNHTCAALSSGALWCWGWNNGYQLSDGTTTDRTAPVLSGSLSADVALPAAGYNFSCAVLSSGSVRCWGANASGQIGDGTTTLRSTPTQVSGLTGNPGFPVSITVTATNGAGSASTTVLLSTS